MFGSGGAVAAFVFPGPNSRLKYLADSKISNIKARSIFTNYRNMCTVSLKKRKKKKKTTITATSSNLSCGWQQYCLKKYQKNGCKDLGMYLKYSMFVNCGLFKCSLLYIYVACKLYQAKVQTSPKNMIIASKKSVI